MLVNFMICFVKPWSSWWGDCYKESAKIIWCIGSIGSLCSDLSFSSLEKEWTENGYREFICEDFHVAYQIYIMNDGTEIVRIHDACHSFIYWRLKNTISNFLKQSWSFLFHSFSCTKEKSDMKILWSWKIMVKYALQSAVGA